MSVKLSAWVWDGCATQGVKGIKLLVMARLADFSSDEGICWPAVETIARQVGAGRSTVITAITQLEKEGWLTRTERRNGQRSATNLYTLNAEKLREAAASYQDSISGHSKSGPSEKTGVRQSEHSDSEHSESERPNPERSKKDEKPGSEGSESGHDPSLKQDPSIKQISTSENSGESSDGANSVQKIEPAPKGKWGTQEDHQCAEWIFSRIKKLYEKAAETDGEVSRPKDPNWNIWANEIRLMRAIDGRSHRQICELFKRVQSDSFWCKNVLSPSKLREKWDELFLKLSPVNASQGSVIDADFDDEYYENDLAAAARSGFRV